MSKQTVLSCPACGSCNVHEEQGRIHYAIWCDDCLERRAGADRAEALRRWNDRKTEQVELTLTVA